MINAIKENRDQFSLAIPGGNIRTLEEMMRLLMHGQTSRHGSRTPTRLEKREEAEMAVQLAVTLVEWFASGKVRRRPVSEA
jgi:hypothetical protein